ncbi:MAG TPA: DNA polymerase III subunit [Calditrichaeota bacterium]|nr:DNA polymerase III subunit [Calditrichota bacterium]
MTYFDKTIVQERVQRFFVKSIEQNRLAHAYIFYGSEGRGKEAFAFELAKAVNCLSENNRPCNSCSSCVKIIKFSHPDLKYFFAAPKRIKDSEIRALLKKKAANAYRALPVAGHKTINIEMIRQLKNEAKYAPHEAQKRFFIISDAHLFTREAANSFLKLLEEPPENLHIILITSELNVLLDTIRSRCQPVFFPPFDEQQINEIVKHHYTFEGNLTSLIRMAQFNLNKVFNFLEDDPAEKRELVYALFQNIAKGNISSIMDIIDRITGRRDKNLITDFLSLMILWLRDAMNRLITGDESLLVNTDYNEAIRKFADYFETTDFASTIALVEEARFDIERNGHPALILTNLVLNMSDALKRKTSVHVHEEAL